MFVFMFCLCFVYFNFIFYFFLFFFLFFVINNHSFLNFILTLCRMLETIFNTPELFITLFLSGPDGIIGYVRTIFFLSSPLNQNIIYLIIISLYACLIFLSSTSLFPSSSFFCYSSTLIFVCFLLNTAFSSPSACAQSPKATAGARRAVPSAI